MRIGEACAKVHRPIRHDRQSRCSLPPRGQALASWARGSRAVALAHSIHEAEIICHNINGCQNLWLSYAKHRVLKPESQVLKLHSLVVPKGRKHVAWGVSPRKTRTKQNSAPEGRQGAERDSNCCRPSGAKYTNRPESLGLAPQAICCRHSVAEIVQLQNSRFAFTIQIAKLYHYRAGGQARAPSVRQRISEFLTAAIRRTSTRFDRGVFRELGAP